MSHEISTIPARIRTDPILPRQCAEGIFTKDKEEGGSMKAENEVFELCKQVYEATGWGQIKSSNKLTQMAASGTIPLYTSDYILEKLPAILPYGDENDPSKLRLGFYNEQWSALYESAMDYHLDCDANTPIEALLKLTLKLDEEKLL